MAQSNLSAVNGCMVSFTTIFNTSAEAARETKNNANTIATLKTPSLKNRLRITFPQKAEMLLCPRLPMRCHALTQRQRHSRDEQEHGQDFVRRKLICLPPGPIGPSPDMRQAWAVTLRTYGRYSQRV